ncbi:MAG: hypothetical protein HKN60_08445, partial [Rhizobiales bacterium]|nr:hypothetical protein [Hyphomicrobiales bacterium]
MTTRLIRLIGLAALALGFISISAPQAQADGFPYRRNHAFESEISSQKPMCLPPEDKRPEAEFDEKMAEFMRESGEYGWWALRLGYHGASECLAQNLIDPGQWIKYGSLYVAFLLSPTLVSTYAGGELTTDAAKCVAKAFVENSDTLDREQKDLFRSGIDTAASVKDAFSWVENGYKAISPVAEREKIRKLSTLKKLYDILDTARDRGEDLQGLIAFAAQEVEDVDRYLQYVFGYGSHRAYLNAEDAYRACRYDDAEALLDKSRAAAEQECKVQGAQYRAFERDIRIYINNNHIQLQVGREHAGENPQERTLKGLYDTFKIRKDALRKSLRSFAKADKLSQDIARAR